MTVEAHNARVDAEYERALKHVKDRVSKIEAKAAEIDASPKTVPARPEPLRRACAAPAPYPVEALGPILAPAAEAIQRVVRSPLALCGQSVLGAAALAAQPHADVEIDGRRFPLHLWLVTVAESGERKSGTDNQALHVHREVERELFRAYRDAVREHEIATREWRKQQQGAEESQPEPIAPLHPALTTREPTIEGLLKLLMIGTGTLGLFSDEGGTFVGGHAMNRDNQVKTAAGLSGLWDRGEADRVRSGDGASKLYGKRLSLHLMLQPVIAERVLADPVLSGQGFLARCLIAWPDTAAGGRFYVAENVLEDRDLAEAHRRFRVLLETPAPTTEGARNEIDPPCLRLTPEAKALWVRAHDRIERMQAPGSQFSQIRATASKAAENILRVAGVLTVISGRTEIDIATVDNAVTLVLWHLGEAARLAGVATIPPEVKAAEEVLRWCWDRGKSLVHSGELVRLGPASVRTSDQVRKVMQFLVRHRWATPVQGGAMLDGSHRRLVWNIEPEAAP